MFDYDADDNPVFVPPGALPDPLARAALLRTIGLRLRAARGLCNLDQQEAARRLGYASGCKLAKVESGAEPAPLWLLYRAACLYHVSIDFLFGASDDDSLAWELGPRREQEREVLGAVDVLWQQLRNRDAAAIKALNDQLWAVRALVDEWLPLARKCLTALTRVEELNPEFQDLKAGATLVHCVERMLAAAQHATLRLARFRTETKAIATVGPVPVGGLDG